MEKRKTDVRELQDTAFLMFENAKKLVDEDKKDEAISVYLELIKILNKLRWTNVIKKIQEAIRELQKTPDREVSTPTQEEIQVQQPKQEFIKKTVTKVFKGHVLSVKEFEFYKQQEENIQNEAFKLLDSGSSSARQKDFEKAIEDYNQAIILLNSIGWQSYTPQLQDEVEKLVEEQKNYNNSLQQRMKKPEIESIEDLRVKRESLLKEIESRKISVKEFEKRRKLQYNYLVRVSQLLIECEGSITNLDYAQIYKLLQQSAQNLINVGWQEGVTRLTDFINTIKENQFQHELMEQQEHLAYIEKIRISDDIRKYFSQKMIEQEKERTAPFRPVDSNLAKSKTKSYEQQVLEVVSEASQIPATDDDSSKRKIELYNVAYHLIEKSKWSEEKSMVHTMVDILRQNLENRKLRIQTMEQNKISTLNTLKAISNRISEYLNEFEKEKDAQKNNLLKFQKQQQSIHSLENSAFKYIDIAKKYVKNHEYDEAIQAYNEAISKFRDLMWNEQILYLVHEVEKIQTLKSKFHAEQKLKDKIKEQEKEQQLAKIKAERQRKEQELQDLDDISKMISTVVKQKEIAEKNKQISLEEYRKNVEIPEEDKQIEEVKDLIRKASRKKSD